MDKEESKSLVKEPDWSYGKYSASLWMTVDDTARSSVIQGFELDLEEFFKTSNSSVSPAFQISSSRSVSFHNF